MQRDWSFSELGYLAGIIDGEGYVCVGQKQLQFVLCMADTAIMVWVRDHFGGTISPPQRTHPNNVRPVRRWTLTRKGGLVEVAHAVVPHLILKRRETGILLMALAQGPALRGVRSPETMERRRLWRDERADHVRAAHEALLDRKIANWVSDV